MLHTLYAINYIEFHTQLQLGYSNVTLQRYDNIMTILIQCYNHSTAMSHITAACSGRTTFKGRDTHPNKLWATLSSLVTLRNINGN